MAARYPVLIIWPAGAPVATIRGQWTRLADGRIEATYGSQDELGLALAFKDGDSRPATECSLAALMDGPMEPAERPEGPCGVCGAMAWWERPAWMGGRWVCGVCHPNPYAMRLGS